MADICSGMVYMGGLAKKFISLKTGLFRTLKILADASYVWEENLEI